MKNSTSQKDRHSGLIREIICIGLIALSIYLFISIFIPGSGGFVGIATAGVLRGFFGLGAFLIPVAGVLVCLYTLLAKNLNKKMFAFCALFVIFIVLLHVTGGEGESALSVFAENQDSAFAVNGGALGAFLGNILIAIVGSVGTVILMFVGGIISVMAMTGKSFGYKNSNSYKIEEESEWEEEWETPDMPESKKFFIPSFNPKDNSSKTLLSLDIALKKPADIIEKPVMKEVSVTRESEIQKNNSEYIFPGPDLLTPIPVSDNTDAQIPENSHKLEQTLQSFGVSAQVINVSKGPTVTRYELLPGTGVKVSKISSLADDLALNLAAKSIRIEAPIPGKSAVGIEIPNEKSDMVYFRELTESPDFTLFPSDLALALGKNIAGEVVIADLTKMPHILIAGTTGSGKSVCINTLIMSLIYKSPPNKVKLIMIDPKVVELSIYNGIPHLLIPVVTEPKKAAGALSWASKEMISRYELFSETNTRDLAAYNEILEASGLLPLPQIVIIIDELGDLMMAAPREVEDSICRLAQMARAAGIHLIIATQRPSVDVLTGLIKANIPSRLAFSVSSGSDSRTILDTSGAEKLLGRGDMLFFPIGSPKPVRVQGAFISDKEVENIVNFLKDQAPPVYNAKMIENITSFANNEDVDEFFEEAVDFLITKEKASASMLQRQFRIGYQRAARLMDSLQKQGIIGPEDGSKPRKVLLSRMDWEEMKERK